MSSIDRSAAYNSYYGSLRRLREEFHSTGRFDDANAKLDEITKLIVLSLHEARQAEDRFSIENLRGLARDLFGDESKIALALRRLSEEIFGDDYLNPDGTSIFGAHPALHIQPTDDEFATRIVQEVRDFASHFIEDSHFDLVNESFGHFVRDTFHQTKDDAQYMTPDEVVRAMTRMAIADVKADSDVMARLQPAAPEPFVAMDPTCGVGSFLVAALRGLLDLISASPEGDPATLHQLTSRHVVGQDKVDRMVRLAQVNLRLFGSSDVHVSQGNSIIGESAIDAWLGQVDLILTNPPFSAEYSVEDVVERTTPEQLPITHQLARQNALPPRIDSELLLFDRDLALLRPGGRLLIVVPDKVVSAAGAEAAYRAKFGDVADVVGVVALPSVTFAQAGTRTRTCFAYLRKLPSPSTRRVFMATADHIGFDVVNRTGAPVKLPRDENDLESIIDAYVENAPVGNEDFEILTEVPSAVSVRREALINGRWTPGFYHARRLRALADLDELPLRGFELRPLSTLARLSSRARRRLRPDPDARTISVLHIGADGIVDIEGVLGYSPKTAGLVCRPSDVLFSKINPRIPRVSVVPVLDVPLVCSSEFEILEPIDCDPYLLAALLVSEPVQRQVQHLTSGTSQSHNRIKDSELSEILVPWPVADSSTFDEWDRIAKALRIANEDRYAADRALQVARTKLHGSLEAESVAIDI